MNLNEERKAPLRGKDLSTKREMVVQYISATAKSVSPRRNQTGYLILFVLVWNDSTHREFSLIPCFSKKPRFVLARSHFFHLCPQLMLESHTSDCSLSYLIIVLPSAIVGHNYSDILGADSTDARWMVRFCPVLCLHAKVAGRVCLYASFHGCWWWCLVFWLTCKCRWADHVVY